MGTDIFTIWSTPTSRTPSDPPRPRLPLLSLKKRKAMVEKYIQTGEEEYMDDVDKSQTYDTESNLLGVSGLPMMDLSVRSPRRIPHLSSLFSDVTRYIIHDRFSRLRPQA